MKKRAPHNIKWVEICQENENATTTNQEIFGIFAPGTIPFHFKQMRTIESVVAAIGFGALHNPGYAKLYYAPLKDTRANQDDFEFVSCFLFFF